MARRVLGLLLLLSLSTLGSIPGRAVTIRHANLPVRGLTMKQVRHQFGQPQRKHPPVGRPPIARWDYTHFVVVFEYNIVQHTVVPSSPPKVYHHSKLERVPAGPPTHQ